MSAERQTLVTPIVVVGASAGGIETVRAMLQHFPADLRAAVAIVIHRAAVEEDDRLARVLSRGSALSVSRAIHGEVPLVGHAYIAPAGAHLELRGSAFALSIGPKENSSRPSIDVLFRSAAAYGPRTIGVILSGVLDDGTAGLAAIKAAGGFAIVQDPEEALFGDMPRNAILNVDVDAVESADAIGATVSRFIEHMAGGVTAGAVQEEKAGIATRFGCPDCGGVLSEFAYNNIARYICRTGHAYSPAVLFNRQYETVEWALWAAVRALEERAEMSTVLASRLTERGRADFAQRLQEQSTTLLSRAAKIREGMATLSERSEEMDANDRALDA